MSEVRKNWGGEAEFETFVREELPQVQLSLVCIGAGSILVCLLLEKPPALFVIVEENSKQIPYHITDCVREQQEG
eukprot:1064723-Pleurochrysis_carterae.AAC.1